jgi:membrane protease YdiL (CAAX protease family)
MMAAETLLLTVPLVVIFLIFQVASRHMGSLDLAGGREAQPWLAAIMSCIGAGIFEELLFRLLMVGGTLFVLRVALKEESPGAMIAVVLIAAAIFSGAHVLDHPEQFVWDLFFFRAAAGIYLGFVFFYRGFGVATGVHIVFNLALETASLLRQMG